MQQSHGLKQTPSYIINNINYPKAAPAQYMVKIDSKS